jgi:hypothetical protein
MRPASIALAGLVLLVVVPAARADRGITPPGNSGVSQYRETIPSSTGNRIGGGTGGSTPGQSSALPPSTVRALGRSGADGRAAARALGSTVPSRPSRRRHDAAPPASGGGESPARTVLKATAGGAGDGGLGLLLPIVLAGTLVGAAAFVLVGRRWRTG